MKMLLFCALFFYSQMIIAKPLFQPLLDHKSSHELTWTFSSAVKNWGKDNPGQVKIKCDGKNISDYQLLWSNAQTLKVLMKKNLTPGARCVTELNVSGNQDQHTFNVPHVKVEQVYPWNFESLDEDAAFVVMTEVPVDSKELADLAYVEVEGLGERVELDAVTDKDTVKAIAKNVYSEDASLSVLKPRRRFPLGKKILFVIPEKMTFEYKKEGKIREPFRATLECERTKADAPCSPLGRVSLNFNSEVRKQDVQKIRIIQGSKVFPAKEVDYNPSYVSFDIKLDPSQEYKVDLPSDFSDVEGRRLANARKFPLTFRTAEYPPLAKFPGPFGILEAKADPVLPVAVRNVEKQVSFKKSTAVLNLKDPSAFLKWLNAIRNRQHMSYGTKEIRAESIFARTQIPVESETLTYTASKNETELIGLPLQKKGLHLVELSSDILGRTLFKDPATFYVSTAVLVTNLVAHLKVGETNSLVWVTSLDKGEPVAEAEITLHDCNGKLLEKSAANKQGFALFKTTREALSCQSPEEGGGYRIMAIARKADDVTFTFSNWNEGIEAWRFSVRSFYGDQLERTHTVFDRPIYRPGETVHMLHLIRHMGDEGLKNSSRKYSQLRITNQIANKTWNLPLTWRANATSTSEFSIPEASGVGGYVLYLVSKDEQNRETLEYAGIFQVEEFRVPLMRSKMSFEDNRQEFSPEEKIKLLGHLEYLSGSPASETPVALRTEITKRKTLFLKELSEYSFNVGKPGEESRDETLTLEKESTTTDKNGGFRFILNKIPRSDVIQTIMAEVEYQDPNGIFQTNTASAQILPYAQLIGIKTPERVKLAKGNMFQIILVNQKRKPQKNKLFEGRLLKQVTHSTRKKILGGFYTYDSTRSMTDLGKVCEGKTNKEGRGHCEVKLPKGGHYFLLVKSGDSQGFDSFYAYGDDSWSDQEHHDRMDIITDKKSYAPGETARLELKLPFESGTALVTKERAGIKESFVTSFSRKSPFISVPVKESDFPNVFVSALVVRGRIGSGQPSGVVDLSKPAYRMGLTELRIEKGEHKNHVSIKADKEIYKVREKVKLFIKVQNPDKSPVKGSEVAISVFDEGLLLLGQHNSFDAFRALFTSVGHGVTTATAQTHVIGKRHFGIKAKPQGGGGGAGAAPRQLFDTLLYWNPTVSLNSQGEAVVEFALNDSLTSFKVHVLAYGTNRFGNADISITSTQDIIAFNGTSPAIRTQDRFSALYTLKNMTSVEKPLTATLKLNGKVVKTEEIILPANESKLFQASIPPFEEAGSAEYLLTLMSGAEKIDEIKTTQKILPLLIPQVKYSDLKQITDSVVVPGSKEDRLSGIELLLSPTLLPSLSSLRSYMEQYEYTCLEQQLARAIIMEDEKLMQKLLQNMGSYVDERKLLKFYPTQQATGSLLLTAHVLEVMHWQGRKFDWGPDLEQALVSFIEGKMKNLTAWEQVQFSALKLRAMAAIKLVNPSLFNSAWLIDVPGSSAKDSLLTLMHKWAVHAPSGEAAKAQEFIRMKFKVDGSLVSFLGQEYNPDFVFSTKEILYGRFLLLQKTLKMENDFGKFFSANEGKFIRGFLNLRRQGFFPETTSNTYAFLLHKKWDIDTQVSGTTHLGPKSSNWNNNEAPPLALRADEARNDQKLSHNGKGSPWGDIRYLVYPDPKASSFRGVEMELKLPQGQQWKVQDRIVAELVVRARNDIPMAAITLPLPAGSTVLSLDAGSTYFEFEERSELLWRGYVHHLRKGEHKFKISFRLNQPGVFQIPGARIEAMYSPDISGQLPYWEMSIK